MRTDLLDVVIQSLIDKTKLHYQPLSPLIKADLKLIIETYLSEVSKAEQTELDVFFKDSLGDL